MSKLTNWFRFICIFIFIIMAMDKGGGCRFQGVETTFNGGIYTTEIACFAWGVLFLAFVPSIYQKLKVTGFTYQWKIR